MAMNNRAMHRAISTSSITTTNKPVGMILDRVSDCAHGQTPLMLTLSRLTRLLSVHDDETTRCARSTIIDIAHANLVIILLSTATSSIDTFAYQQHGTVDHQFTADARAAARPAEDQTVGDSHRTTASPRTQRQTRTHGKTLCRCSRSLPIIDSCEQIKQLKLGD